jgi:uncharacterized membrane protein YkvA (DUF1232 family)
LQKLARWYQKIIDRDFFGASLHPCPMKNWRSAVRGWSCSARRYFSEVTRRLTDESRAYRFQGKSKKLKTDLPAVFLALKKKETPVYAKILAGVTILLRFIPHRPNPDFIPVLGYIDDLIVLPALIALTIKLIPKEIFVQCRVDSEGLWQNGKPIEMVLCTSNCDRLAVDSISHRKSNLV